MDGRTVARNVWIAAMLAACAGAGALAQPASQPDKVTVWSGELVLDRNYEVPEGYTLRIEPGTIIEMGKDGWVKLEVKGTLEALGTKDKPIEFRATRTLSWSGIRFVGPKAGGRLEHVIIHDGRRGAINITGASPVIRNCTLLSEHNSEGWIFCDDGAAPTIEGCTIAYRQRRGPAGVLCAGAAPKLSGNTFANCAIGVHVFRTDPNAPRPKLGDNTGPDCDLLVFDEDQEGAMAWQQAFESGLLAYPLMLTMEQGDAHDAVTVHEVQQAARPEEKRVATEHRLVFRDGNFALDSGRPENKLARDVKVGTIDRFLAADGNEVRIRVPKSGGGLMGLEGCADTQPSFVVLLTGSGKDARLAWRSPKLERGHVSATAADLDGDGRKELVVTAGRWCEQKGQVFVFRQVSARAGPASRPGATQPAVRASSQQTTQPATADPNSAEEGQRAELRRRLERALGDRLRVLDEVVAGHAGEHGGRRYWIVRLEPKEVGTYSIDHRCDNTVGMYNRSQRVYGLAVLPANAARTLDLRGTGERACMVCLGDRVILPIEISPRYRNHEFSLHFAEPNAASATEPGPAKPLPTVEVVNPLKDRLEVNSAVKMADLRRDLTEIPFVQATFTARKAGLFNLGWSADGVGGPRPANPRGQPIAIFPRDQRLDVVISAAVAHDFTEGSGSWGTWDIGLEAVVLRVGDTLRLRLPWPGDKPIALEELPFRPDGGFIHRHTTWRNYEPVDPNASAATQPAEDDARAERIAESIEQLGHATYRQRDAAQAKLIELGGPALPPLREARRHEDPEVASRATRAIEEILSRIEPQREELRQAIEQASQRNDAAAVRRHRLALLALPEPPLAG